MKIFGLQPAFSGSSARIPGQDRWTLAPVVDSVYFSGDRPVCPERKIKIAQLCLKLGIPAPRDEKAYHLLNHALKAPKVQQRLEFLGDSVVTLVVRQYLMKRYPSLREGALTQLTSMLTCNRALTTIGDQIGVESYIICLKKHASYFEKCPHVREKMVADTIEALAGALYTADGDQTRHIRTFLLPHMQRMLREIPIEQFMQSDKITRTNDTARIAQSLWPLASDGLKPLPDAAV